MKLASIHIYPVKSCGPIDLESASLTQMGLALDRRWMLVDRLGRFLTARRYHQMLRVSQRLDDGRLVLSYRDKPLLDLPMEQPNGDTLTVKVWSDTVDAIDCGAQAAAWFGSILKTQCRLVYIPGPNSRIRFPGDDDQTFALSFADGYPLLVCTDASLDALNKRLDSAVNMRQFRPNIVLSGATEAFAEDHWSQLKIANCRFLVSSPCSRCVLTTVDPESAVKSSAGEPLATLKTFRLAADGEVYFGMNLKVVECGELRVGSEAVAL